MLSVHIPPGESFFFSSQLPGFISSFGVALFHHFQSQQWKTSSFSLLSTSPPSELLQTEVLHSYWLTRLHWADLGKPRQCLCGDLSEECRSLVSGTLKAWFPVGRAVCRGGPSLQEVSQGQFWDFISSPYFQFSLAACSWDGISSASCSHSHGWGLPSRLPPSWPLSLLEPQAKLNSLPDSVTLAFL